MWLFGLFFVTLMSLLICAEQELMEAVFQGRCGHQSPCDQLCYELHDGIVECDCTEGFEIDQNGYSCRALNSSYEVLIDKNDLESTEDIFYQKTSTFSAKLQQSNDEDKKKSSFTNSFQNLVNRTFDNQISHIEIFETNRKNENMLENNLDMKVNLQHSMLTTNLNESASIFAQRLNCDRDCGYEGICDFVQHNETRCICPFQKYGDKCEEDLIINVPRFGGSSWLAFPAFKAAYKHIQINLEFRPESLNGILLLTGERDDLTGDFVALLLNNGYLELWFDCGSGTGQIKSDEAIILNEWSSIIVYRHRGIAWIEINKGRRIKGRSKGLFSRITFREPVFLGGSGNITTLKKIPVNKGFEGCIRKFAANGHTYDFESMPTGDVSRGFDIYECSPPDKCRYHTCKHSGKCVPTENGPVCLCPLNYVGEFCEKVIDLQVPFFNGSSYLRYPALEETTIIWFELKIVFKPHKDEGLILYSGHHEIGDFISLSLNMGYVDFTFDLGSGPATVRSEFPLSIGKWTTVEVSRTSRLAVLKVDKFSEVMTVSPNGFWHLSLPHNLFLGGVRNVEILPTNLRDIGFFTGCVQKISINDRPISLIEEALGGSHVVNCEHACVQKPCGPLASCVPNNDNFECICNPKNKECNKAEEVSSEQLKADILHRFGDNLSDKKQNIKIHEVQSSIERNDISLYNNVDTYNGSEKSSTNKLQYNFDVIQFKSEKTDHDKFSNYNFDNDHYTEHVASEGGNGAMLNDQKITIDNKINNDSTAHTNTQGNFHNSIVRVTLKKISRGACFSGENSYFHYNDAHTMKRINNHQIDLNVRFKTIANSRNGLILWTGKKASYDYFLLLGIIDGYLNMEFNLGSGKTNIQYNLTKVNDGTWHRVRALRNQQTVTLKVDGGNIMSKKSLGKLRAIKMDGGLYIGGMPKIVFHTRNLYSKGMTGCITEVVLSREFQLDLNPKALDTAHNVNFSS